MTEWGVEVFCASFFRELSEHLLFSDHGEVGAFAARCVHQESKAFIVGMRSRCW